MLAPTGLLSRRGQTVQGRDPDPRRVLRRPGGRGRCGSVQDDFSGSCKRRRRGGHVLLLDDVPVDKATVLLHLTAAAAAQGAGTYAIGGTASPWPGAITPAERLQ